MARSGLDYVPVPEGERSHRLKRIMDELFLKDPCLGTRRLVEIFRRDYGEKVNRKMLQRLRREMGIGTLWCRRKTSQPALGHRKFPYLLRDLAVVHPNQVWCADITYVPMPHGHAYLCAVMDWYSRKVLGWAVSNTMDSGLCLEALEMAVSGNDGKLAEIFNTDQGSQFTGEAWLGRLEELGITISMDGRGRWMDNVFIERLWRSVKYEDIYLKEYAGISDLRAGLREWFERYNTWRPHTALGNQTPAVVHLEARKEKEAEAISGPMPPECGKAGLSICSDTRLRLCGHTTRATIA